MIKKVKITKAKTLPFDKYAMDVAWTPDGSMLLVSGEAALGMISRNEDWKLTYSTEIAHKMSMTDQKTNIISCLAWINDTVLVTAGTDKSIKFWDFTSKKLLNFSTAKNDVL